MAAGRVGGAFAADLVYLILALGTADLGDCLAAATGEGKIVMGGVCG